MKHYRKNHVLHIDIDMDDVVQEARLAAFVACKAWDSSRHPSRSAWAARRVLWGLQEFTRGSGHLARTTVATLPKDRTEWPKHLLPATYHADHKLPDGSLAHEELPVPGPSLEDEVLDRMEMDKLHRAVQWLPWKERVVAEGMLTGVTPKELAASLGLTKQAITWLYQSAAERLRQYLRLDEEVGIV